MSNKNENTKKNQQAENNHDKMEIGADYECTKWRYAKGTPGSRKEFDRDLDHIILADYTHKRK